MSPLPGEHSCRLAPPGDYREFARKNDEQESDGKKIDVIYGIFQKDGKRRSKIQSLRYKIEDWEEEQAKSHCETRKGVFEPAKAKPEPEVKAQEAKNKQVLTETHKYFFASPVALKEGEHQVDIEILREGSWAIRKAPGGVLDLTKAKLLEFVKNFRDQVVGSELPLDIDHEGPTVGWLRKLWIQSKDGLAHLWARLDITDPETQAKVKEGSLRYFSPSLEINWQDPETKNYFDLIRSGALTNWPFIKNMQPATVLNFSEIEGIERKTEGRKVASQISLMQTERDEARKAGKTMALGLIKAQRKIELQEKVIVKVEMKAKIDNLVSCGDLSPYEGQEMRSIALSEPKSVELAITLLAGRGKAWQSGQISILSPKKGSRLGLTELMQAVDKEKDPERHDKLMELVDNRIGELKREKGLK